jgi:NTP pyrophosphatase (non-canonical NTP hydrolase)
MKVAKKMGEIEELTKKIVNFRNKRKWVKYNTAKNMAISLLLEAAEFLELFQWTKENQFPEDKREQVEEELVDVLYWVLLIAHDFKIDLKKVLNKKMKKNEERYPL